MIKIHDLKTHPAPFNSMKSGLKTFEYRLNDRNYQPGDYLHLMEYDPETAKFTGQEITVRVSYILHGGEFGVPDGYCIMSVMGLTGIEPLAIFHHK